MGLHSIVFNLYGFAVTLAVAGIGLAVTRLVSEYEAANDRPGSFAVVRRALLCVGASGGGIDVVSLSGQGLCGVETDAAAGTGDENHLCKHQQDNALRKHFW